MPDRDDTPHADIQALRSRLTESGSDADARLARLVERFWPDHTGDAGSDAAVRSDDPRRVAMLAVAEMLQHSRRPRDRELGEAIGRLAGTPEVEWVEPVASEVVEEPEPVAEPIPTEPPPAEPEPSEEVGRLTEDEVARMMGQETEPTPEPDPDVPAVAHPDEVDPVALLPRNLAFLGLIVPLRVESGQLVCLAAEEPEPETRQAVEEAVGMPVRFELGEHEQVSAMLEQVYGPAEESENAEEPQKKGLLRGVLDKFKKAA